MQTQRFFLTCAALGIAASVMGTATQVKAASIASDGLYAPGTPLYDSSSNSGSSSPFVTTGAKWGASQTFGTPGGVVTYSFMPTGVSCTAFNDCSAANPTITALASFMPTGFQAEIKRAFDAWSAVANIQFQEVADSGTAFGASGARGDIRIGGHTFDGALGVLAHAYFPAAGAPSAAGDLHFDIAETWQIGFNGPGIDIFQVAAHEIGHAIGLDHTNVANSLMNPFYSTAFSGPQADDIAGAQFIYGASTAIPTPSLLAPMIGFGIAAFRKRKAVKA